jgi:hypothetical protein
MTVTIAQFQVSYPDFDGFTDAQIEDAIALAEIQCPDTVWDVEVTRDRGIKLLSAHYLECQRLQQAMSAATAQSVAQGQASVNAPSGADDLDQTLYGQQFKRLRRTLPKRLGFAF